MKVTIITPCLNSEKTITQTIESVLKQTYQDIEYIIVDGKSTDRTVEIIKKYIPLFSGRLNYISEKDQGIYDAMNKGLLQASGEIIGIINSDDWYETDAVEKVVQCFQATTAELVYGKLFTITQNGNRNVYPRRDLSTIWYQMPIAHPTVFVKRDIYNRYGRFDTKYRISADYELILRFYCRGVHFYYLDCALANFRLGGISEQQNLEAWKEAYNIAFCYANNCPNKEIIYPVLKENYHFYLLENLLLYEQDRFRNIICRLLPNTKVPFVIFGIGNWGEKCYNVLSQIDINVSFFVDNNATESETFMDKPVLQPDILHCSDKVVLVAIRNDVEVVQQLQGLAVKSVITLRNIINAYLEMYKVAEKKEGIINDDRV